MKEREIRAIYNDQTIRVYQAYCPEIARPALAAGRFVPPFKMGRMTWIKPSFCWMMYRCGYATKEGQEYVLGIDITRDGFEWALSHAAISSFGESGFSDPEEWKRSLENAPVRIQWDPERDLHLNKFKNARSIQIGLSGESVERYVKEWIVGIEDVTPVARRIHEALKSGKPITNPPTDQERVYPLPAEFATHIRATLGL